MAPQARFQVSARPHRTRLLSSKLACNAMRRVRQTRLVREVCAPAGIALRDRVGFRRSFDDVLRQDVAGVCIEDKTDSERLQKKLLRKILKG